MTFQPRADTREGNAINIPTYGRVMILKQKSLSPFTVIHGSPYGETCEHETKFKWRFNKKALRYVIQR